MKILRRNSFSRLKDQIDQRLYLNFKILTNILLIFKGREQEQILIRSKNIRAHLSWTR